MYNPCNEIMPLVEVYQRWLNDHTRLAVRYGISTRKTHHWHTLTTTGIMLADGRQVTMVVPSCLLLVSPAMNNAGSHVDVHVVVNINSLRTYPGIDSAFPHRSLAAHWRIIVATAAGPVTFTTHYHAVDMSVSRYGRVRIGGADESQYAGDSVGSITY
ncbi:hypothetical protein QYK82_002335 [Salmonella enterica]|nr:hypothetical protein [Salmonella enterica]